MKYVCFIMVLVKALLLFNVASNNVAANNVVLFNATGDIYYCGAGQTSIDISYPLTVVSDSFSECINTINYVTITNIQVPYDAFSGAVNLEYLYIWDGDQVSDISLSLFEESNKLNTYYFQNTNSYESKIITLPDTIFSNSDVVDAIYFRLLYSKINTIPQNTFKKNVNKIRIDIDHTNIENLDVDLFGDVKNIDCYIKYDNNITDFIDGIFENVETLNLILQNNPNLIQLREEIIGIQTSVTCTLKFCPKIQCVINACNIPRTPPCVIKKLQTDVNTTQTDVMVVQNEINTTQIKVAYASMQVADTVVQMSSMMSLIASIDPACIANDTIRKIQLLKFLSTTNTETQDINTRSSSIDCARNMETRIPTDDSNNSGLIIGVVSGSVATITLGASAYIVYKKFYNTSYKKKIQPEPSELSY